MPVEKTCDDRYETGMGRGTVDPGPVAAERKPAGIPAIVADLEVDEMALAPGEPRQQCARDRPGILFCMVPEREDVVLHGSHDPDRRGL
jgi:hypothetical protein